MLVTPLVRGGLALKRALTPKKNSLSAHGAD